MAVRTTIPLPWTKPPLTANQRLHWAVRARLVREVRITVGWLARTRLPQYLDHITVGLEYTPRDRRRRDEDNLVPTLKACCDGIVDAGIVPDDTPNYMSKMMPTIIPPGATPKGLRLIVDH